MLSMIHYMLTMPVEALQEYFSSDYTQAQNVVTQYGDNNTTDKNIVIDTDYSKYDALDPQAFSNLMNEATKYIGTPYVWGGSTPSTGFDCSGFVCWSYTASGVYNLPRTTAQGIYDEIVHIPESEAKAGDIVFFTATYSTTSPVTHVGIYLGNGVMLAAGDPIGYTNIHSAYWTAHLYGFGRVINQKSTN